MRNTYGGTCYRCQLWCKPREGHFERFKGSWRVQHATCAIQHRGTPDPGRTEHRLRTLNLQAKGTGKQAQRARKALRELAKQGSPHDR